MNTIYLYPHIKILLLLGLTIGVSCASKSEVAPPPTAVAPPPEVAPKAPPPKKTPPVKTGLPSGYTLRDTVEYDSGPVGGWYTYLYHRGTLIDSVDVNFGIHRLGKNKVVFLPVGADSSSELGQEEQYVDILNHVVADGRSRTPLKQFVPHLDDYFSSPTVIDNRLYYWGLLPTEEDRKYRLMAMRYHFTSGKLDSTFLAIEPVETDDRGYLSEPVRIKNEIHYRHPWYRWILDPRSFRLLRWE